MHHAIVGGRQKGLAIHSSPEPARRREIVGVGVAFGVTVMVISLLAGQGMLLALTTGFGGGLMYALGWRFHQSSEETR